MHIYFNGEDAFNLVHRSGFMERMRAAVASKQLVSDCITVKLLVMPSVAGRASCKYRLG